VTVDLGEERARGRRVTVAGPGVPEGRQVLRFDGLPYAEPPTGERRFRPPVPRSPTGGVLDATAPRPAPPQRPGPVLGSRPVGDTDEACLHLNVVTPDPEGARPVLVWIHGGGFVNGSAADAIHAGERLVARGDVVLVTLDYRLGALGFLHTEDGDNLGLRDQIAALRWVRAHVDRLGGDPARVTVFGESAGAMCIRALMATPAADALFTAAILQSGAGLGTGTPAAAERVRHAFAEAVGSDAVADWRALDTDALLDAQARVGSRIRAEAGTSAWRPFVDGDLVRSTGVEAQARPVNRQRPVIVGMNADEQRLFVPPRRSLTPADALDRLAAALTGHHPDPPAAAARALDGYAGLLPDADPSERLAAAETDLYYRLPLDAFCAARADAGGRSWRYLFARPSPALRGRLGACHALEIPFVFGTLDAPGMERFAGTDADAWHLSERMMDAWCAFARDGRPAAAAPDWGPWDPETGGVWVADDRPRVIGHPAADRVAVWHAVLDAA
jgi:para-nitrobenzyl esterase